MTLAEMLAETDDYHFAYPGTRAVQVYSRTDDPRYFGLTDYLVTTILSGPSFILVEREPATRRRRVLDVL